MGILKISLDTLLLSSSSLNNKSLEVIILASGWSAKNESLNGLDVTITSQPYSKSSSIICENNPDLTSSSKPKLSNTTRFGFSQI